MKSNIISFFAKMLKKFYNVFAVSYENSIFKKCSDFIRNMIAKASINSKFVSYFTKCSNSENIVKNSIFYKVISAIFVFIKKFTLKICVLIDKSLIVTSYKYYFKNVLNISMSLYGIFIMAASLINMIFSQNIMSVIIFLIGFIISLLKLTPKSIIAGSFILKKIFSYLDVELYNDNTDIIFTRKLSIIFLSLGLVIGLLSVFISPIVAFGTLCFIVFIPLILYNFKLTVYLIPIALPYLPTMALVGIVMVSFLSMVIKMFTDNSFTFKKTSLDFFLIALGFVWCVSAFTSVTPVKSIQILMVYIAFIISYFLITNSVTTKKQLYALISIVLLSSFFVALYGIYQFAFGFDEGKVWIDNEMFSEIETRVVSTFENPNVLGEYLLLMIPLTFAFIWKSPNGFSRLSHFIIAGALALCMIFTYSRGNWIGLAVACMLFFAFYDRKFIWLAVVAVMLSPMFLPQNVIDRFLSIGNTNDTSTSYRVNIWFGTIKMLKDFWITGIGLGEEAFSIVYSKYAYSAVTAPHSHNLYLQLITENGILGIVVFVSMMFSYYRNVISAVSYKKRTYLKALILGLSAGMFGYLVQGLFDNVFYNYRVVLLFFVILGLTSASINIYKESEEYKNA